MPRPIFKPGLPAHVDPAKLIERHARRLRRKGTPKLRVVAGTAEARAIGIGR